MAGSLVSSLDPLRPALKEGWTVRLQRAPAGPPGTGLVTPEMLVDLVDGSIDRLIVNPGGTPTRGQTMRSTRFNHTRASCQCGLHLLLTYYLAGARTLRATLPADSGPARREVVRRFNRLAREEMTALCDVCNHRGGSLCPLRPPRKNLPP